jgi:hypothetical protein
MKMTIDKENSEGDIKILSFDNMDSFHSDRYDQRLKIHRN